jgi:hypothetical protein
MRINVEFGGGADAVFFDITRREVISYEMAAQGVFHSRYGGKVYYRSRTGLSGAGWYDSSRAHQLIKFGWYRPEYILGQERQQVAVTSDNYTLYGYLPIKLHEGIDRTMPAVLVQFGGLFFDHPPVVAFVPSDHIDQAIRDWHKIAEEAKLVKIPYCNLFHAYKWEQSTFHVKFWNQHRFRGVNLVRFLEGMLDPIKEKSGLGADERNKINTTSLLSEHLHIYPVAGQWAHWNALGYCDKVWSQDPRELTGPLAEGWNALGDGVFARRAPKPESLEIDVVCSIARPTELCHGDLSPWAESFHSTSVWALRDLETLKQRATELAVESGRSQLNEVHTLKQDVLTEADRSVTTILYPEEY